MTPSGVVPATAVQAACARAGDLPSNDVLLECLTRREQERALAIGLSGRRREFITARCLAKALVLGDATGRLPAATEGAPGVRRITATDLGRWPCASYREIDIARASDGSLTARHVHRDMQEQRCFLALSHAAGWICAGASSSRPIGVDIAEIATRQAAFYRAHFTAMEREWVSDAGAAPMNTLYTMLWSLKEALIKAGVAPQVTLWGYDEIELFIDAPATELAARLANGSSRTGGCCFALRAGETEACATVSRDDDLLYSLLVLDVDTSFILSPERR